MEGSLGQVERLSKDCLPIRALCDMLASKMETVGQSNRLSQADSRRLRRSFGYSIVFHLALIAAYTWLAPYFTLEEAELQAKEPIVAARYVTIDFQLQPKLPKEQEPETPDEEENKDPFELEFVDANPAEVTAIPPDDPRFQSYITTRAANPDPLGIDVGVPMMDGRQKDMLRLMDVRPEDIEAPKPPPSPELVDPQREPEPMSTAPRFIPEEVLADMTPRRPGEMDADTDPGNTQPMTAVKQYQVKRDSVEPTDLPNGEMRDKDTPSRGEYRPRTIAEAKRIKGITAGELSDQLGGVRRRGEVSVDALGTAFGIYQSQLVNAVSQHWYALIGETVIGTTRSGVVTVSFRLHSDGTVSRIERENGTVGELWGFLCERAIQEPASFGPWPSSALKAIKEDYVDIRFTFHYY